MLINILIFLCSLFISEINSEVCSLSFDNGDEIQWSIVLTNDIATLKKDTPDGTPIRKINVVGAHYANFVKNADCEFPNYFNIRTDEDGSVVFEVKSLSEWDADRTNTDKSCRVALQFDISNCEVPIDDPALLQFQIIIEDVNLSPPTFENPEKEYNLKIAFPIAKSLNLTNRAGVPIAVKDTDFSTETIQFTLTGASELVNENFRIDNLPADRANKIFPMSIVTKNSMNLLGGLSMQIEANDNFPNNPLIDTATVHIVVDHENSDPPLPKFSAPIYELSMKSSELFQGALLPETVMLLDDFNADEYQLKFSIEPSEYFSVLRVNGIVAQITVLKDVKSNQNIFVTALVDNGFVKKSTSALLKLSVTDSV